MNIINHAHFLFYIRMFNTSYYLLVAAWLVTMVCPVLAAAENSQFLGDNETLGIYVLIFRVI